MASKVTDVILIYAEWCGACKMFVPTWDKIIEPALKNIVKVHKIESNEVDNHPLLKIHNIKPTYYPIIYKIKNNVAIEYKNQGDRTLENIQKWITLKKGGSRKKRTSSNKKGKKKGGCGCGNNKTKKWFKLLKI
jgi:thiol-disulfide isomerase/thioredoxin